MFIVILLLLLESIAVLVLTFSIIENYLIGVVIAGAIIILVGKPIIKKIKVNKTYLIPLIIISVITIVFGFTLVNETIKANKWKDFETDMKKVEYFFDNSKTQEKKIYDYYTSENSDVINSFDEKCLEINKIITKIQMENLFRGLISNVSGSDDPTPLSFVEIQKISRLRNELVTINTNSNIDYELSGIFMDINDNYSEIEIILKKYTE